VQLQAGIAAAMDDNRLTKSKPIAHKSPPGFLQGCPGMPRIQVNHTGQIQQEVMHGSYSAATESNTGQLFCSSTTKGRNHLEVQEVEVEALLPLLTRAKPGRPPQ
jgi:hypothetical protein